MEPKCIIMCAGEFTPVRIDRQDGDLVIAADGGVTYLERLGVLPDLIIGDFDSVSDSGRKIVDEYDANDPSTVVKLPVEKDDTDTLAAVKEGLNRGYKLFYFYSALGGRLDHTMANIQTLVYLKEHGAKGYIMSADSMLLVLKNEALQFHKGFEGTFSVFSLEEKIEGVTIEGMQYEVQDAVITNSFPIGVSNHITADRAGKITVAKGTALVIVSWKN